MMMFFSSSVCASVGDAWEDGEASPRRSRQQDGEVPLPGHRKPRPHAALVQERERVQEGPEDRRLQGTNTENTKNTRNTKHNL